MLTHIKKIMDWFNDEPPNKTRKQTPSSQVKTPVGFCAPWTIEQLNQDEIIKDKLRVLKRSGLALPYEVWDEFVVDTVIRFATWCQEFPASESYHHAGPRGLLLHSLDVAIYAMRIRRNYILPPNTPPEDVIHKEIVWVYGVFLCALLHDVGKVLDLDIELDAGDKKPVRWTPALGAVSQPYRFRYHKARQYSQHQHSGLMWLTPLLTENPMLAITSDRQLYHEMSAYLSGHADVESVIGQIVAQADAASVAQNLGADKAGINLAAEKARGAVVSLAGQLRMTLTHLLQSGAIPLNKKGAEGFVDGERLYLMSKPIADRLRVALLERGITSVPSDNSRLFNELQQHQLILANDDEMAIWKCEVYLSAFDWRQTFTFVCVHWPAIWPEGTLPSIEGSITPVATDAIDTSEGLSQEEQSLPQTASVSIEGEGQRDAVTSVESTATGSAFSLDLMSYMPSMEAFGSAPEISHVAVADAGQSAGEHNSSLSLLNTVTALQEAATADIDEDIEPEEHTEAEQGDEVEALTPSHILLQKFDVRSSTPRELGEAFYQWIDAVLKGGVHPVNRQGAMFHRLEQGMLVVSPGAFRCFVTERCQCAQATTYSVVQQGLQPLGKHIQRPDGRSVHKALIKDSERSLNGFMFPVLPEWADLYAVNPHVMLEGE